MKRQVADIDINVGIVAAPELAFTLEGPWRASLPGIPCEGPLTARVVDGRVAIGECIADEVTFSPVAEDSTFVIENVMIGIDFHWERAERQRFEGALQLVAEGDRVRAINIINVERYLKSVISSEMNASSPVELLKAHAVISRSWLLAQILNRDVSAASREAMVERDDEIVRWWDREDHIGFDVCADDHCQRYQGITRATRPEVAEAVDATRGCVLTFEGRVCDARFSKCCGGRSELFESCWGDGAAHRYLVSVDDTWCNTNDVNVLATVLNGYDHQSIPGFYRWTVRYTASELAELVKRRSGIDFGRIRALVPLHRGPSGRITHLLIEGDKRTMTIGKELLIRRWLSDSHLYSSAFEVEEEGADAEGFPSAFTLRGRGWGHGVGLCQIGAAVMAANGLEYTEILQRYFPLSQILTEI